MQILKVFKGTKSQLNDHFLGVGKTIPVNRQPPNEDYPIGGSIEPYDIERDKQLIENDNEEE